MFRLFRATSVVATLVLSVLTTSCGEDEKDKDPTPTATRKTELRLSIAGTEALSSTQARPTAFVTLRDADAPGSISGLDLYNQTAANGDVTLEMATGLRPGATYSLSIKLQKAATLMKPETVLKAGVYLDGVLQRELLLNNSNYASQGFSGSSSTGGAVDAVRTADFQIN